MSLLSNNKKDAKKGSKITKGSTLESKFSKQGKAAAFSKKPIKTGGTRGS